MRTIQKLNIALIKPPLVGHQYRGTGEYTRRLYGTLKKNSDVNISLLGIKSNLDNFDIVHFPYFDPFFLTLPVLKNKPRVVTVHDLIPLKFPQYFPVGIKGFLKWQVQKASLLRTDAVLTDSEASRKDIIKYTGIDGEKIYVIYLGVGKEFKITRSEKILNKVRKKLNLPDEFILHVGDVNYNKNIEGLVRAFSLVCKSYSSLNLVLVGDGFVNSSPQLLQINDLINSLALCDKVYFIGHVNTDDLVGLYNLAKVYLQPSFAEGFGLPVLEAMACGCPVVVSNTSSLPEIVGKAAILADPYKVDDIKEAMLKMLHFDPLAYRSTVERGLRQVKKYSWEKTVAQTIAVYRQILQ